MAALQPLYTANNCTFSGPLRWGVAIFWRAPPPVAAANRACRRPRARRRSPPRPPLLRTAREPICAEHSRRDNPLARRQPPQRPVAIPHSCIGAEGIPTQLCTAQFRPRHARGRRSLRGRTGDAPPKSRSARPGHARTPPDPARRRGSFTAPDDCARYLRYNLHIVLVHRERWAEVRQEVLGELAGMIERVSRAKSFALSRAGSCRTIST
jgi:hypothetical protein